MVLKNSCSTITKKHKKFIHDTIHETEEERINKIMDKNFHKKYPTFEDFQNDLVEKIGIALKEVDQGLGRPIEELFKEMEEKYRHI